ncbi:MAG TPA: isopentenyl phosphate kinase [Thermoplasmata archaeon]|nr:isopentenyl phosphate kinase [Thermoplasmata archaeon]
MARSPPVIVKLGGSVLTRKRGPARIRPKVLSRLSAEIATSPGPVVVLHGAGSFGHPGARRFGLARPPTSDPVDPKRMRGAAIVSAEVRSLHLAVLDALVSAGARPWSAPAGATARQAAGRLVELDVRPYRDALDRGLAPVGFGDVVPDRDWGVSILSADTLAVVLAERLHARRVVFVSDVPGVLGPRRPGPPAILPEVTDDLLRSLDERDSGPDVTGGIRGKVAAMLAIARGGADAGLISGLSDGALSRALRGEPVYGSWAKAVVP